VELIFHCQVWEAAGVELVATAGLTFLSITVYLQAGSEASAAFLQALIYSVAILAAAPVSGGHLNPAVTFTTFLTGHATLTRSALYVVAQLLGGVIGAAGVRLLTSAETRTRHSMGGCVLQELLPVQGIAGSTLSNMQGLFAEMVFTIIMLFVVYGIGFDKRSVVVTFPIVAPVHHRWSVGCSGVRFAGARVHRGHEPCQMLWPCGCLRA
jgi:aquaporin-4